MLKQKNGSVYYFYDGSDLFLPDEVKVISRYNDIPYHSGDEDSRIAGEVLRGLKPYFSDDFIFVGGDGEKLITIPRLGRYTTAKKLMKALLSLVEESKDEI
jgi:hypothetical protein